MRKLIREMIKESLFESRKIKQQFYDQVRSKYPDIDNAYFVTWWGAWDRDWETKYALSISGYLDLTWS